MSLYNILLDIIGLAGPVIGIAAITSLILVGLLSLAGVSLANSLLLFPVAFAILGGISGAIVGSSSEPLVGGLVTGTLGIVTALLSYGLATTGSDEIRTAIPPIIILLLFNAIAGLSVGKSWRTDLDHYALQMERYRADRDGIWVPTTRDYQMQVVRRCIAESPNYRDAHRNCSIEALFPRPE